MHKFIPLFILFTTILNGEVPDWVKDNGKSKQFPEIAHLTGFGMWKLSKGEEKTKCMQLASDAARKSLIEKIRVTVKSNVTSRVEERGEQVSSFFAINTQTSSSLELQGLDVETYFDDDDDLFYALAHAERITMAEIYQKKADALRLGSKRAYRLGLSYEQQGEKGKALQQLLDCCRWIRDEAETRTIATVVKSPFQKAFDELNKSALADEVTLTDVTQAIDRLLQKPIRKAEDLAWSIAYCLKTELRDSLYTVTITPFTYQDTKMSSPFSKYMKQLLESQFVQVAHWQIAEQPIMSNTNDRQQTTLNVMNAAYIVTGTYWKQLEGMKFIAQLRSLPDSKVIASTETIIDTTSMMQTRLSPLPENFTKAMIDQRLLGKDEIMSGGLILDVWTNKGNENLIYTRGETMRVFVRVNLPCYIRFLYHLASGQRALLTDNYYIDESKINKAYEIPESFLCDAPYGAEFLQVFASNEKFEQVKTKKVEGYEMLEEDIEEILSATRGMKRQRNDLLQTEQRIVITTMDR